MSDRFGGGSGSYGYADHWKHRIDGDFVPGTDASKTEAQHEAWVAFAEARSLTYRGDRTIRPEGCLAVGQITPLGHTKSVSIEVGLVRRKEDQFRSSTYFTGIAPREVTGKVALVERGVVSATFERIRVAFPWFPIKQQSRFKSKMVSRPGGEPADWPGEEVRWLLESFGRAATFSQDGNIVRLEWPEGEPSPQVLEAATVIVLAACQWQQAAVYR